MIQLHLEEGYLVVGEIQIDLEIGEAPCLLLHLPPHLPPMVMVAMVVVEGVVGILNLPPLMIMIHFAHAPQREVEVEEEEGEEQGVDGA